MQPTTPSETATQRYIRLLKQLAEADGPLFTNDEDTRTDIMGFEELLRQDCITGSRSSDHMDRVTNVCNMRITVSGRRQLEQMQRDEEANTSIGLIKQNRFAIYKWIFEMMSAVIAGYALRWLTAG